MGSTQEDHVRSLMEACPVGVVVAEPDGRLRTANARALEMLGLSAADITDVLFRDLFAKPKEYDALAAGLAAGRQVRDKDVRLNRHDGTPCWVRLTLEESGFRSTPSTVAWIQDLTEQRRAREAMEQGERTLLDVLEQSPVAVGISDREGRFLYWNSKFMTMGRQTRDAKGKATFGLPFAEPSRQTELLERLDFEGSVDDAEIRLEGEDGDTTWALLSLRKTEFENQPAILAWVYDITNRKRQEEALALARQEADVANRAKSDFLATMSHEIRTPMNGVLTMSEMLDQTPLAPEQKGMTTVIRDSATALLTIIDDILDFSKIEAGKLRLEAVSFSITQVVEGVADLLALRANEKDIEFVTYVDSRVHDHLEGDPHRLRQVLLNLAGNAVKFTETGHVALEVTLQDIKNDRATLLCRVRDTGIGIPKNKRRHLFKPFSQVDGSTVRRFGGTGLGLSICKALIDMMGGEIGVESTAGKGSVFWFRVEFPIREERRNILDYDLEGVRVLIASANQANAKAMGDYAEAVGAAPRFCRKGSEVLEGLRSPEEAGRFDVVVINDDLPDISAHDLARSMKEELGPQAPSCVALLPRAVSVISPETAGTLACPIVAKPIKREEFCRTIAAAAGRTAPEPPAVPQRRLDDDGGQGAYRPPPADEAREAGVLLLVAEDNKTNQTVMRMLLDRMGYAADIVDNGAVALESLGSGAYGMLITDCHMPEMDGYQLSEAIRVQERDAGSDRRLPIIALTADVLADTARKCRNAGMDAYLKKPVERLSLEREILRYLPTAAGLRRPKTTAEPPAPPPSDKAAAAPPNGADKAAVPVLDTAPLLELLGGEESMLAPMLADFVDTTRPIIEALAQALDANDMENARKQAHSAAGAAKTAGTMALADVCSSIEKAIVEEDFDRALARKEEATAAFESAAAAIADL